MANVPQPPNKPLEKLTAAELEAFIKRNQEGLALAEHEGYSNEEKAGWAHFLQLGLKERARRLKAATDIAAAAAAASTAKAPDTGGKRPKRPAKTPASTPASTPAPTPTPAPGFTLSPGAKTALAVGGMAAVVVGALWGLDRLSK